MRVVVAINPAFDKLPVVIESTPGGSAVVISQPRGDGKTDSIFIDRARLSEVIATLREVDAALTG